MSIKKEFEFKLLNGGFIKAELSIPENSFENDLLSDCKFGLTFYYTNKAIFKHMSSKNHIYDGSKYFTYAQLHHQCDDGLRYIYPSYENEEEELKYYKKIATPRMINMAIKRTSFNEFPSSVLRFIVIRSTCRYITCTINNKVYDIFSKNYGIADQDIFNDIHDFSKKRKLPNWSYKYIMYEIKDDPVKKLSKLKNILDKYNDSSLLYLFDNWKRHTNNHEDGEKISIPSYTDMIKQIPEILLKNKYNLHFDEHLEEIKSINYIPENRFQWYMMKAVIYANYMFNPRDINSSIKKYFLNELSNMNIETWHKIKPCIPTTKTYNIRILTRFVYKIIYKDYNKQEKFNVKLTLDEQIKKYQLAIIKEKLCCATN